jgi:ferredoxin-NADP reductase
MLSMLHALAASQSRRPVWFIHGARDGDHHPLASEVRDLVARSSSIKAHVAFSQPRADDVAGIDYDSRGRLDGDLLASLAIPPDAQYMLCGPISFMAEVRDALQGQGVQPARIHTETFGPTG